MDSEQIKALTDFVASLRSEITQKQLFVSDAETLLKIATDGYTTDQIHIDTEIQAGKDAVASEIEFLVTSLEVEKTAHTNDVAAIQSALDTEKSVHNVDVEAYKSQVLDAQTSIAAREATINDLSTKLADVTALNDSFVIQIAGMVQKSNDAIPVTDTPVA